MTGTYIPYSGVILFGGRGSRLDAASTDEDDGFEDYSYMYNVFLDDTKFEQTQEGTFKFLQSGTYYVTALNSSVTFKTQTFKANTVNNAINATAGDTITLNGTGYGMIVIGEVEI